MNDSIGAMGDKPDQCRAVFVGRSLFVCWSLVADDVGGGQFNFTVKVFIPHAAATKT